MTRSYLYGLRLLLVTVSISAFLALLVPAPEPLRAVQNLSERLPPLDSFQLRERSGKALNNADLADRVWIAAFIFTRCRASCPRITTVMKGVQDQLRGSNVRLVSFTVDPKYDTPEVLAKYADAFGAQKDRWWFVTGTQESLFKLIQAGFKLAVEELDPDDPQAAMMEVSHSNKLVLVDNGNRVAAMFNSEDPKEVGNLIQQARKLDRRWVSRLPAVNASLNALSTVLLLAGLLAIRSGRFRGHVGSMASALAVSSLFLSCYLLYHAMIGGGVKFQGTGSVRFLYFTVLISHVVLAAVVVPLVLWTVFRALKKRFEAHAQIASFTYPIWMYVSITGVIVYAMLYQLPS